MHGAIGDSNQSSFVRGLIDFTGGSLGGVATVYVSQPLDTVKVKMQSFPHLYKGTWDCLVNTYRKDRIRGLYAGSLPAVAANVAENSVLFAAYGGCQKFVAYMQGKESIKDLTVIGNAFSGSLAAFFSTFTLCPTELIKCKLQALRETSVITAEGASSIPYISPFQLTKQIFRNEGIPGFFRGLTPTFAREMPGYFFFFGGYEGTRELLKKPGETKDDIGPLKTMLAGAIGGVILWIAIFPADVIKSRIQVNSLKRGMYAVGVEIFKKEGPLALYNGLLPSVLRTIPATASLLLVYEYTKKFINSII